jgi:hypothetical protein
MSSSGLLAQDAREISFARSKKGHLLESANEHHHQRGKQQHLFVGIPTLHCQALLVTRQDCRINI